MFCAGLVLIGEPDLLLLPGFFEVVDFTLQQRQPFAQLAPIGVFVQPGFYFLQTAFHRVFFRFELRQLGLQAELFGLLLYQSCFLRQQRLGAGVDLHVKGHGLIEQWFAFFLEVLRSRKRL